MRFKENNINIGMIKAGTTKKIVVTPLSKETLKDIVAMESSCGCTRPKIINDHILIEYTPGPIPIHLQSVGQYRGNPNVTIHYIDETKEVLYFSAIIKK